MPVRKVPKSYRNVTGVVASQKSVGEAQFESTLERDHLALLDFSSEVIRYEVQPVKIEWQDKEGRKRSYTPDVLVEFDPALKRKPWLCEVKYRSDIKKDWEVLHEKFRKGVRYARSRDWRFRLVSEVEIRTPLLENVRFLAQFRNKPNENAKIDMLRSLLEKDGNTKLSVLLESLSKDPWEQAAWLPVLWHLIATGEGGVDLSEKLNMDSVIWAKE